MYRRLRRSFREKLVSSASLSDVGGGDSSNSRCQEQVTLEPGGSIHRRRPSLETISENTLAAELPIAVPSEDVVSTHPSGSPLLPSPVGRGGYYRSPPPEEGDNNHSCCCDQVLISPGELRGIDNPSFTCGFGGEEAGGARRGSNGSRGVYTVSSFSVSSSTSSSSLSLLIKAPSQPQQQQTRSVRSATTTLVRGAATRLRRSWAAAGKKKSCRSSCVNHACY